LTLIRDTSALLRRYVDEVGTPEVLRAMEADSDWVASAVAESETELALCRLLREADAFQEVRGRFRADWARFHVVPVDPECLSLASQIGCAHGIRTLDAIHLAAASRLPPPATILTFDTAQAGAARALGLPTPSVDGPSAIAAGRVRSGRTIGR
jgi:uncharacterized protein